MKKLGLIGLVILFFINIGFSVNLNCEGLEGKDFYRTFEIIDITENGMVLQDNDGNTIVVDKDPANYKIGYKVRYDSVRKRLRAYRWQDYKVITISGDSLTLQHKTGDTLSVQGNFKGKYNIGDQIRYDSVGNKLQPADDSGQWKQYEVVAANSKSITLKSTLGEELVLQMDNNLYLVRYNAAINKLKKGVIRTYDWQEYKVKEVTKEHLILLNKNKEELVLENTYGTKFTAGV
jgi:hypothetical protein